MRLVAGLSSRRSGFEPGSLNVGFLVDKVALGQVLLRVLRFSPVNIIPPWLYNFIYHLGMKSRPTDDRCSETVSPIDKNNKKSQTKILHAVYPALREGRSESIQ
jgi:hypothetical protein